MKCIIYQVESLLRGDIPYFKFHNYCGEVLARLKNFSRMASVRRSVVPARYGIFDEHC